MLQTAFAVKKACYQLHLANEKIAINQETLKLLADLETIARAQNEAGKVTLQDVLRAEIEQERLATSIKNLKVGIQTLDLLAVAGDKLRLILNRANSKVHLDVADVERALGVTAEFHVPSDIAVPQAVNRGVPIVIDRPRSPAAQALIALAARVASAARPERESQQQPRSRRMWRRSA